MGKVMNIRGVILLCFVVVIPYTTTIQGQAPSGMPLNVETPTPTTIPLPAAMPMAGAPATALPTPIPPLLATGMPMAGVPAAAPTPVAQLPVTPVPTPPAFQDMLAPIQGTPPLATPTPVPLPTPAAAAPAPIPAPLPLPTPLLPIPEVAPAPTAPTVLAQATPPVTTPPTPIPAPSTQGRASILAPETLPAGQTATMPGPTMRQEPQKQSDTPTPTKPEEKESKDIYLNFDNTELANFINYIAEIKKLNLIPDKGVEGNKISLTIREPLSIEGAWNVFLTIIEMAGFSIIQAGDVYKIVPKDKKATQPLPAYINIPVDKIPDNDSNIRYVMFLTNLQAADMKDLIQSMLSDKGSVVEVKDVNGMIITDKCFNIKTAVRVLQELDHMGTAETVSIVHLKNANAKDVKELLDSIIKAPELSPLARLLGKTAEGGTQFFPPGTRIIPEERTNSLILMGNPKPIKKIEEFIVNNIDTELKDAKSPLHVFELQFTDATQIADILNEVTQAGDSTAGQAAAKYGAIRGGVKYFKKMNFKVDKEGNRLIVSSTDKVDWKLLKQTIKDLDKPQPQVAIETLLVTVQVDDSKMMGGNVRIKKPNQIGTNIGFQSAASATAGPSFAVSGDNPVSLLGDLTSQVAAQQGLSVLTFGKSGNIWSIFNMLKSQTNSSVISQPFITATNKAKATVTVGENRRVIQETSGTGQAGYTDAKAATTLEITPQINIDGVIRMHLRTEINDFAGTDSTKTTERSLETDVTVADGQVLVLGGFVRTQVSETKYKTPLLGDLPLFGWFFKNQKRDVKKTYLFIFMCPTIVKPRQLPGMGLYTKMKLHDVTDSIEDSIQTKKLPDPVHNWFFNAEKENYSHKVIDFANARYQPTTIDLKNDPYYRTQTYQQQREEEKKEKTEASTETAKSRGIQAEAPQKVSPLTAPILTEKPLKPLPPHVATALQLDQKREGLKNLLTNSKQVAMGGKQAPTMPEPIKASLAVPEKRTQLKELISATPVTPSFPTPEQDNKRTQFKQLISSPKEAPAITSHPSPSATSSAEEELSVDVSKRNRLKEFLSNNPAIAHNTAHFDRSMA